MSKEASKTSVITGKVRFSYAHVFEPQSIEEGGPKKYSVSLIIPKDDTKTINAIKAAIEVAKEVGKIKLGGKIPANLKTPLRDGDTDREDDDEAYNNSYFINANSNNKPGIVDADLNALMDKEEFYSGCYGRADINFYAFAVSGNKGIAAGLNNLQKLEDGERLAGGRSAEEAFGGAEDLI
jgi:hypothetical protein